MIPTLRSHSQHLSQPTITDPVALVQWLGAVQAQEYNMAKWALGIRLKKATLKSVQQALDKGDIVRTHVMRPTWHFVAGEDIRWMLGLTAKRIKSAYDSYGKGQEVDEALYTKVNLLLEKMLTGTNGLTKQEIAEELTKAGIVVDNPRITLFLVRAETEALVCSGVDEGNKITYALLEERVAPAKKLTTDEALAKLATRYFQSHSPATLQDFLWWSGLTVKEARHAIGMIEGELIKDRFVSEEFFVHQRWGNVKSNKNLVHLLPSYDEYLISYKDRTHVLPKEHYPKAFNNYGIFYPVIVYKGKVIGNWNKKIKAKQLTIETSFFEELAVPEKLLSEAQDRYKRFLF